MQNSAASDQNRRIIAPSCLKNTSKCKQKRRQLLRTKILKKLASARRSTPQQPSASLGGLQQTTTGTIGPQLVFQLVFSCSCPGFYVVSQILWRSLKCFPNGFQMISAGVFSLVSQMVSQVRNWETRWFARWSTRFPRSPQKSIR